MDSNADTHAISLRNVTKIYRKRVHALRGISMEVRRGEIFGLLGPNGAGKSTLVKIMMTVVRPTEAMGAILGKPVGHKPTLRHIGYLPENHRFPRYLTGRQVIEFFSALAGVDRQTRRTRAAELLNVVGMSDWGDTLIGQYSKGMMQRIGLAQALGADPQLVVLDEPTDGVDPAGRRDIREVFFRLREEGKTVFINSHLLSELETVCDRVAMLIGGVIARQGTIDELTRGKQHYWFELEAAEGLWTMVANALPGAFDPAEIAARNGGGSNGNGPAPIPLQYSSLGPGGVMPVMQLPARGTLVDQTWCEFDGVNLRLGHTQAASVQGVIDALRGRGVVIRRMQLLRPTLEQLFLETVGNSSIPGGSAISGPGAAASQPQTPIGVQGSSSPTPTVGGVRL